MPIQVIADRRNVTFILVAHHGKAEHSSSQNQILSSVAWVNVPRSVWQIYLDKEDKELRYLAPAKTNDCTNPTTISFRIVSRNGQSEGRVEIVDMNIPKNADDFMREQRRSLKPGRKPDILDVVIKWLQNFLVDGPKSVNEIMEEAKAKVFSKSTLDRAKEGLGIKPKKDGKGGWIWKLPSSEGIQNTEK